MPPHHTDVHKLGPLNPADHAVPDSIWGPWESTGNPCIGEGSELRFGAQSTFGLPLRGEDAARIFTADIWRPENPIAGRYLWLPIEFEGSTPVLRHRDSWSPANTWGY